MATLHFKRLELHWTDEGRTTQPDEWYEKMVAIQAQVFTTGEWYFQEVLQVMGDAEGEKHINVLLYLTMEVFSEKEGL